MGNDKKLTVLDAECYNCKEIIVPVDQGKEEDGKKLYTCPNCGSEFTIEKTIVFEEDFDVNPTIH